MVKPIKNKIEAFIEATAETDFACKLCDNCCRYPPLIRKEDYKRIKHHLPKILKTIKDDRQRFIIEDQMGEYFPLMIKVRLWKKQCMFCQDDKCTIHGYALDVGIPYWELKPFGCAMYPAQEDDDGDIYISTHQCPPEYYKV